jgi:adenosine deaminase
VAHFEQCLHITVHAGETKPAGSIWKAVYTLNAERIGHGLKLIESGKLLGHFLDRGISVEMCPSSNFQIVGFRDNHLPETSNLPVYPLKSYLEKGLKVLVNTDNPGISRTDATKELMRAARLTPGGLSRMDILNLVKNGFRASFAGYDLRRKLLLAAEKRVLEILQKEDALSNE